MFTITIMEVIKLVDLVCKMIGIVAVDFARGQYISHRWFLNEYECNLLQTKIFLMGIIFSKHGPMSVWFQ